MTGHGGWAEMVISSIVLFPCHNDYVSQNFYLIDQLDYADVQFKGHIHID